MKTKISTSNEISKGFKCVYCGATVSPITFINGDIYCPKCYNNLLSDKFKILNMKDNTIEDVARSSKLFALSQNAFNKYLLEVAQSDELDKEAVIKYAKMAVNYCRTAAFLGNPYALKNLAFYSENGYDRTIVNGKAFAKKIYTIIRTQMDDEFAKDANDNINRIEQMETLSTVKRTSNAIVSSIAKLIQDDDIAFRKPVIGLFRLAAVNDEAEQKTNLGKLRFIWSEINGGLFVFEDANTIKKMRENDFSLKSNFNSVVFSSEGTWFIFFAFNNFEDKSLKNSILNQFFKDSKKNQKLERKAQNIVGNLVANLETSNIDQFVISESDIKISQKFAKVKDNKDIRWFDYITNSINGDAYGNIK